MGGWSDGLLAAPAHLLPTSSAAPAHLLPARAEILNAGRALPLLWASLLTWSWLCSPLAAQRQSSPCSSGGRGKILGGATTGRKGTPPGAAAAATEVQAPSYVRFREKIREGDEGEA